MQTEDIRNLLKAFGSGEMTMEEAMEKLTLLPYEDLGFANLDHHRALRQGFPEVIFCQGKTVQQVVTIFERLASHNNKENILATRATQEMYQAILQVVPEAIYYAEARIITVVRRKVELPENSQFILVVTAGTSDIPVAEEAAITAEIMGNRVERLYDVGVAGLHRLLDRHTLLQQAQVLVVVAGMEGALASVIGGLVNKPVIAVPTSIGYGASFGGIAALLSMLNSCAAGVAVVNIDNGFGAGRLASIINKL